MVVDQEYWNPVLERLPREKIGKLQLKKFKRIFQWAYDHSKFHRSLYDAAGITPDDIRSLADIRHVPKVVKAMMQAIQCQDPFPYGDALCVPLEEVVRSIEGLGDEYEVVVDKLGDVDRIKLKVELMPGFEDRVKEIESRLKDKLRLKTNLGYRIEFYDYGKLPRYAVKAARFKDLRKNKTGKDGIHG